MQTITESTYQAAATKQDQNGVADKLRNLKSMLDEGIITEADYEAKKAELLKGM
ncbi:MAG: SHOCT domain-containing protein [Planctomycetota bacterium]